MEGQSKPRMSVQGTASLAESLASLPETERASILASLSDAELKELEFDWRFWARPSQIAPGGDWNTWLALAGRGFGKTEAGAQWVRERVKNGARSIALIAETQKDLEEVMVARLLAIHPENERPSARFKPVRITWPNGAVALGYNGTEPDQLRGPEFDTAWCFIAGTLVETDNGAKRIEQVLNGCKVRTRTGFHNVAANGSRTTAVGAVSFSNGQTLVGTPDHPVYTANGWTKLSDLQNGDVVCAINVSNGAASVVSTWRPMGQQRVYCLSVDGDREYFANGILVHNCDELAKYRYARELWDMLQFTMRAGNDPRVFVTTTPRPISVIKEIVADAKTVISRGTTFDNAANLPHQFLDKLRTRYEGTRLGRQELNAEILDDVPGALWTRDMIDAARKPVALPDMARIVVAVDPSGTRGESDDGDSIGIVVAGKGVDGRGYVLADRTCKLSPAGWGRRAVGAYHEFAADRLVAERNFGGAMVEEVIRTTDQNVSYAEVTASRGKVVRAEPIAALYEQDKISHAPGMTELEDQMCQMCSNGFLGEGSPDRVDALVWALTDLMLGEAFDVNEWIKAYS